MTLLNLCIAPNPIFKKKAQNVEVIDNSIRNKLDNMLETMYHENAIGMGANMVGLLDRLVVIDIVPNGKNEPILMINPEITYQSDETQIFDEASICFPGISAKITRARHITVEFLDYDGNKQKIEADGWLSTVIQHEIDYLDGKVFLDYLSNLKRNILLKKMNKFFKNN